MRLLHTTTRQLEAFPENQIPRYAILSHTWGTPAEEASFQDLQGGAPGPVDHLILTHWTARPGWKKIEGASAQSLKYDCRYLWVDTCCIDKSSSAELQEGINSMFRWYESAEICLAYLSDVSPNHDPGALDSSFRNARWFTRGWTLQELLAPKNLVFFDQDWNVLGTKESLSGIIEDFTDISARYINWAEQYPLSSGFVGDAYESLSEASVAERMSWAAGRQTTRKEDMAYCLLGLFGIHMPMLYGEGDRAFAKLQEEIMKTTDDTTLLSWGYKQTWDDKEEADTILAPIPASFKNCYGLVPSKLIGFPRPSFSMTQKGLVVTLPVRVDESHDHIVYSILACGPRESIDEPGRCRSLLALPLISAGACEDQSLWKEQDEYLRFNWCSPTLVSTEFLEAAKVKTIVIRRPSRASQQLVELSIRLLPPQGYSLVGMYPLQPITWLLGTRFVSLNKSSAGELPSWIEAAGRRDNFLMKRDGHDPTFHSEEGQRMFHIKTSVGSLLVVLEYQAARVVFGASTEFCQVTNCRIFEMPSEAFQLELCHDLAFTQDFTQLREIQPIDRRGEDTIFKVNSQDRLAFVVRAQSLDNFFTRTRTSIKFLTVERFC